MPAKNSVKTYLENAYYHLYNRGVNKRTIYKNEHDYKTYLSYLKLYLTSPDLQGDSLKVSPSRTLKNYATQIDLLAYCLMPNHFHLLVKQSVKDAIDHFMRSISTKYTRYFNVKYNRVGPLYQSVYKAVRIESDEQLLGVGKYIHRNPLGILPTRSLLEGYSYSSYPNYLGRINQTWVKPQEILSFFSQTNPTLSYQSLVEETDIDPEALKPFLLD